MNNVSHTEALKKGGRNSSGIVPRNAIQRDNNAPENEARTQVTVPIQSVWAPKYEVDTDTLSVSKMSFVIIICHTINVASQLKKKSCRIKTIVEAAGGFPEMRDVEVDQIHALLTATEVGENLRDED